MRRLLHGESGGAAAEPGKKAKRRAVQPGDGGRNQMIKLKKIHSLAISADGVTAVQACNEKPSPFLSPIRDAVTCRKCLQFLAAEYPVVNAAVAPVRKVWDETGHYWLVVENPNRPDQRIHRASNARKVKELALSFLSKSGDVMAFCLKNRKAPDMPRYRAHFLLTHWGWQRTA